MMDFILRKKSRSINQLQLAQRVARVLLLGTLMTTQLTLAAPTLPPKPDPIQEPKPSNVQLEGLQPSEVEAEDSVPREELLLPSRKIARTATVATVGYWSGAFADSDVSAALFGGINRTMYDDENLATDLGLELLQSGHFGVQAGRKWILLPYKYGEPFFRIGVGSLWRPSEGIGTLINVYRYQLRASVGFEDLAELKRRWRTELMGAWGLPGFSIGFSTSFAF